MNTFGQRLKFLREASGLTQQELAEKSGFFSAQTISKYENGYRSLNSAEANCLFVTIIDYVDKRKPKNVVDVALKSDNPTTTADLHIFEFGANGLDSTVSITGVAVLQCLSILHESGSIPPIPKEWWIDTVRHIGGAR